MNWCHSDTRWAVFVAATLLSAKHYNKLQHTTARCNTLQHTAHCSTLQHTAAHSNTLQHTALQHTAAHSNTLQHNGFFFAVSFFLSRALLISSSLMLSISILLSLSPSRSSKLSSPAVERKSRWDTHMWTTSWNRWMHIIMVKGPTHSRAESTFETQKVPSGHLYENWIVQKWLDIKMRPHSVTYW